MLNQATFEHGGKQWTVVSSFDIGLALAVFKGVARDRGFIRPVDELPAVLIKQMYRSEIDDIDSLTVPIISILCETDDNEIYYLYGKPGLIRVFCAYEIEVMG